MLQTSPEKTPLTALTDPRLASLFLPPPRLDSTLATYAHLPLIGALLTMLTQDSGLKTAIFLDASAALTAYAEWVIVAQELDCRVISLDQNRLSAFRGQTGLLHIDATRLSKHPDIASLPAKLAHHLTNQAIVVFHGTETETGAEAWQALSVVYPHVLFPHGAGLGLLAPGGIPVPLQSLMDPAHALAPAALARLRSRLALLGQYWADKARLDEMAASIARREEEEQSARTELAEARFALLERRTPDQPAASPAADAALSRTQKLRRVARNMVPPRMERFLRPLAVRVRDLAAEPPVPLVGAPLRRNVLFVSGEPHTPGTLYRCDRNAAACALAGHEVRVCECAHASPTDLIWADVVVLWRVEYCTHVAIMIRLARERGATIVFDVDDLVFLPALASIVIIDGIRTIGGATEAGVHTTFANMRATMDRADACFGTTDTLTSHMRHLRPLAFTLPNIFDHATLQRSRMAARIRRAEGSDGLLRIGYASGTRTHQRDFALIVNVLARLMAARPDLRLVLFREPGNQRPILLMDEFPSLKAVADQIEWRDTVPLARLPDEIARFDISIAPLELDNVFCEAKSEIKYLEAALAGVPSVVSPTAPYRACIEDGVTGLLATTEADWERCLTLLLDRPDLRVRMALNARNQVLWNFGPERQARLFQTAIQSFGTEAAAANAAETALARGHYQSRGVPVVPNSTLLFEHDALTTPDIAIVVTSHNYRDVIIEALESARFQTIERLELIIVDDASTDGSPDIIVAWARRHAQRFSRLVVLAAVENAGLGGARNIAVSASEAPCFLSLDADNRLRPEACQKLLEARAPLTAYVYPLIEQFDSRGARGVLGSRPARPQQLVSGNYIDAMALVAKWAWSATGGYYVQRDAMGWEDYDLWCNCAEMGLQGAHLPEILADYRVHEGSMTNSVTERQAHKARVVEFILKRHPWLDFHTEARSRN